MMRVIEWIEQRPRDLYGRSIRILNLTTNKYMGEWTDYRIVIFFVSKLQQNISSYIFDVDK